MTSHSLVAKTPISTQATLSSVNVTLNNKAGVPTVDSAALFGGERELLIQHGSERYRLRRTRNGKLILTK